MCLSSLPPVPAKVLVSACLAGENCKYNGGNNLNDKVLRLLSSCQVLRFCPEVQGGLPVPRTPAEICRGVVITRDGQNVDAQFRSGAFSCLQFALKERPDLILLQSRSPSCGVLQHYDGTFSGVLTPGPGISAQLLLDHHLPVMDIQDFPENGLLWTSRLILRPWLQTDAQNYLSLAGCSRDGSVCGWPVPCSAQDSGRIIRELLCVPCSYAIVLRETGSPVGGIRLSTYEESRTLSKPAQCNLDAWVSASSGKDDLLPEAVCAVLQLSFTQLGMEKIRCSCFEKHLPPLFGQDGAPMDESGKFRIITREHWLKGGFS